VIRRIAGRRRPPFDRAPAGRRWLPAALAGNRRDGGAVAATSAVLFGSGVILGIAALVVDIGLIYAEHGQLQRGADAAALKVGQVCARDVDDCTTSVVDDVAARYARDNAANGEADARVCGSGGDLPACQANLGSLNDCVGESPATGDYIQVHANTLRSDDSKLLPPVFAHAVLGGFEGAAVTACARVAWGPPAKARALAMTISTCDWKRFTAEGSAYPSAEVAIDLYDETDAAACGIAGTEATNRGGFRWLEDTDADCRATMSVDSNDVAAQVGPASDGCVDALFDLRDNPRAVPVPVFDAVTDNGNGTHSYATQGFAAFVVTGWRLPDSVVPSPTMTSCGVGVTYCVFGTFRQALVPGSGTVNGPDLGARITALIG
jgi:hypothetical protein